MTNPQQQPAAHCNCGQPIYRHPRGGALAKRCTNCRKALGLSAKRGAATGHRHGKPSEEYSHQIRTFMTSLPLDLRVGADGDPIHTWCAGIAVSSAAGLDEQLARDVVNAIAVLVAQGETGMQIRKRLNPNPFGRLSAEKVGRNALDDYLQEAESA